MGEESRNRPKSNYYGVAKGRKPGIFTSWSQCHKQINGFSGECFKGFEKLEDCVGFMMEKGAFESENDVRVHHNMSEESLSSYRQRNSPQTHSDNSDVADNVEPDVNQQHQDPPGTHAASSTSGAIQQLSELESTTSPCEAFVSSLDTIYSYNAHDIQTTLEKLSIETLKGLHKELWVKMTSVFQPLKDSKLIMRQLKHTLIPDIYQFGLSLVNNILTKDVDKMYVSKDSSHTEAPVEIIDSNTEFDNLLKIVLDIRSRMSGLEKELEKVKVENKKLSTIVRSLECSSGNIAQCTDAANQTNETVPETASADANNSSLLAVTHQSIVVSSSEDSSDTDTESFQPPSRYMKKIRKLERKVKSLTKSAAVVPNPVTEERPVPPQTVRNTLRAAQPPPENKTSASSTYSELYIGGVSGDNTPDDIRSYLNAEGIRNIKSVHPLSQNNDWQSFKVNMSQSDCNLALMSVKWPVGIRIRPCNTCNISVK